ncbi:hypothetical protein [Mesonia maritima]|uniref:Uncharacterized protein n=1 Tax=Mesonia maritima TaxID=1793873 RepID=A0ABU1K4Z8_9FLAO|nr:hypothetical protein [Mesonia maritima]MDR6300671.1 hypothetical protein [Mesonia maritima]
MALTGVVEQKIMPDANTHKHYEAYVKNVQDFLIAEKELKRTINRALKTGKTQTVEIQTKLYALLYSTFSESRFMKVILTPYGFEQTEVDEILKQPSNLEKWLKCLELAFRKFNQTKKGSEIPNKKLELSRIIEAYVLTPSILRNKIAHGQLTVALNSKNTSLNYTITGKIQALDFVEISKWFVINKSLCDILEELIESPNKGHFNNYYTRFQLLESFISRTKKWTTETKMGTNKMKKRPPQRLI